MLGPDQENGPGPSPVGSEVGAAPSEDKLEAVADCTAGSTLGVDGAEPDWAAASVVGDWKTSSAAKMDDGG